MNKIIFVVVFLGLIVALVLVVNGVYNKTMKAEETFTLIKTEGVVSYKLADAKEYVNLDKEEIVLVNHSYVKTAKGSATVILKNNSVISVDENSEFQVNLSGNSTEINQFLGNTWHRVQKLVQGNEYKVETPTSLAAVRGTKFAILVSEKGDSDICVLDGEVKGSVLLNNNAINEKVLTKGKMISILKDKLNEDQKITDIRADIVDSNWYKNNVQLDTEFDRSDILQFRQIVKGVTSSKPAVQGAEDFLNMNLLNGLADKYSYSNGAEACNYVNTELQSTLDTIEQYKSYIQPYYESIRTYLYKLQGYCKDGILSPAEVNDLEKYADENFQNVR